MKPAPTLIVLAAGQGSRYKGARHKLEEPLDGLSLLGCTLRSAQASRLPLLLVTTAAHVATASAQLDRRDILEVSEAEARRGMGRSIAAAVNERSSSSGWLVLPGDMPLVRPQTLRAVADALEQHVVVYAQHHGRRGHPVGFGAELFSDLIRLDGDEGARRIVARYPVHGLELDDPGVLVDVDTEGDIDAVRALYAAGAGASLARPVALHRA
jgi:molybdenum cofactor cytidylyltransferase